VVGKNEKGTGGKGAGTERGGRERKGKGEGRLDLNICPGSSEFL